EAIALEKSDIFAGLEAGGTIILPAEDAFLDFLAARARELCPTGNVETFGRSADATARITAYETDGRTSRITVDVVGRSATVSINAVGEHWAANVAAALLAASQTGRSVAECAEALSGYGPPPGRGTAETLMLPDGGSFTLIDDAYNANPASMRAALQSLAQRTGGRRLAALGDMREIGASSVEEHIALAGPVVEAGVEGIFLAGPEMQRLAEALPPGLPQASAPSADDLWNQVQKALRDGDLLLIKGSNASGMGRLADRLRQWSAEAVSGKMDGGPEGPARVS
ncbi:MAG: cyanophycin synthetase, partial [Hyphomonas sp.]|nr:cyanophycin synthetase [Hyphomonas sp.]